MNRNTLLMFLTGIVLFSSCESENSDLVSQPSIRSTYCLTYDEDDMALKFSANFTSKGKQIWITADSSISFEGQRLTGSKNIFSQIFYKFRTKDHLRDDVKRYYTSEYINEDGKSFKNNLFVPSPIDFETFTNASREEGLTLHWNLLRDSAKAEKLVVKLFEYDNGSREVKEFRIKNSGGSIKLDKKHFENIDENEIGIKICHRSYTRRISAPIAGGSYSSSYCTRMQYIALVD